MTYIQDWQRALGISADGQFGPDTLKASLALLPAVPLASELPWISAMKAVYGLHEVRDKARLQQWLKSDGKTLGDPAALPWCGDAVETAIRLALPGEPLPGALGQNPYYARNWGLFGHEAKGYGSIGVFERGPTSGHVGFLVGEDKDCYHVLGGNQSDSIGVTRIVKARLLHARWPDTWDDPPKPLPQKTASLPVSVNEV